MWASCVSAGFGRTKDPLHLHVDVVMRCGWTSRGTDYASPKLTGTRDFECLQ